MGLGMMARLAIKLKNEKVSELRSGELVRSMSGSLKTIASMGEGDSSMKMVSGIREISSRIKLKVKVKSTTMMDLFTKECFLTINPMEEVKRYMLMGQSLLGNSRKDKNSKVNSAGLTDQNT